MTPVLAVHAETDAAPAGGAGATIARTAIVAPMAQTDNVGTRPVTSSSARTRPGQHDLSPSVTDALDDATGSVLAAIAGTDCTVANRLAAGLPG